MKEIKLPALVSLREFCDNIYPCFTEKYVRHLIKHAKVYGFAKCVVKIGRKTFIDLDIFKKWIDNHRLNALGNYSKINLYETITKVIRKGDYKKND